MTEEAEKRMQERMEALAAQVESLRSELRAVREQAANRDSVDFGGGGEPDWSGAMGKVPDGMVENPAIPPLPDTTAAKDPNRLQYKSLDDREQDCAPPGVIQIHDFDEAPLANTRRIQLRSVTTTGTGGGRKLQLVDPDGNADFQTKWMVPLREAGTGGREIKWACIGGEACLPVPTFTASVAAGTGTPGVVVTPGGTECAPTVDLAFSGLQGEKGDKGDPGDDGCSPTVTAGTEPSEHGSAALYITPCGSSTPIPVYNGKNGADGAPGATGPQGPQGPAGADGADGADGCSPDITITATTDATSSATPTVTVTKGGTACAPTFALAFHGLKGSGGSTSGYSGNLATIYFEDVGGGYLRAYRRVLTVTNGLITSVNPAPGTNSDIINVTNIVTCT